MCIRDSWYCFCCFTQFLFTFYQAQAVSNSSINNTVSAGADADTEKKIKGIRKVKTRFLFYLFCFNYFFCCCCILQLTESTVDYWNLLLSFFMHAFFEWENYNFLISFYSYERFLKIFDLLNDILLKSATYFFTFTFRNCDKLMIWRPNKKKEKNLRKIRFEKGI